MKTTEEITNDIISELDDVGYSRDYFKGFVERVVREYGEQVREECAKEAEKPENRGGNCTMTAEMIAGHIRKLELR